MDLKPLQELKQKLLHDKQLPPVWSFFLDQLVAQQEFIGLGQQTKHAFVEAVVAEIGQQMFPRDATVRDLLLVRIPDQDFVHGGFVMSGRLGGVFYFEDAHIGLVTVAENPPSTEVKYARFSGRPVKPPPKPSRN
jgi:hypothetical protein